MHINYAFLKSAAKKALVIVFFANINCSIRNEVPEISIVSDSGPGASILHGLSKLKNELHSKDISFEMAGSVEEARGKLLIVSGISTGDGAAARLLKEYKFPVPKEPEALTIRNKKKDNKSIWIVSGSDDRGGMYALLDAANGIRLANGKNPMSEVKEITEKPDVSRRAVSLYTMNRAYWESRFYNEDYWIRYFDMLAQNRFNSVVVIFGYENGGFLAPCYPYFFDVEGFPDVRMVGLSADEQLRNLDALNNLIKLAHERGIEFSVGIWDHIYRGGVQGGGIPGADDALNNPVEGLVWGLSGENLMAFTKAALAKFIKSVPELDGIQFRMHGESGLEEGEQNRFWLDAFRLIKETAPDLNLVLRAKGMPESVIQSALKAGVNFTIGTKYWMEQLGMPFHPTHINRQNQNDRRHGYADMLRYPQEYRLHWKLWSGGTSRILLWGNPEYARRFAESTHLYNGDGFEVNEPLATKMLGQPHDTIPFDLLKAEYRYYKYEFERYWHFFQVFGRLGYNPETPPLIWQKEFELRFGKKTGPLLEKALHKASWILPRIIASVYHYDSSFPTTRGWAEKQRLGDLPLYAEGEGSDIQQFASFDEEARLLLEGGETAKILPSENSKWFEQTSADITKLIAEAENAIGNNPGNEYNSTITDLKILSNLALYHSKRIPAAVTYRLFEHTGDVAALEDAIAYEKEAIESWRKIINAADAIYADDLMMGVRQVTRQNKKYKWVKELSGHWKDELSLLEQGLDDLEQKRKELNSTDKIRNAPKYRTAENANNYDLFEIWHEAIASAPAGESLKIKATVSTPAGIKWIRLRYRSVNQKEDYKSMQMLPGKENNEYEALIPAKDITAKYDFMYFIEVMDKNGTGTIYPDLNRETPYVVVKLIR